MLYMYWLFSTCCLEKWPWYIVPEIKKYVFTKFACLHPQFEHFTCPIPDKGTINTYNITLLFPYPYFSLGISFPSMDKLGTPKSICPFNIFLKHFLVTNINQKIIFCIPETQFCPNVQANCLDYIRVQTLGKTNLAALRHIKREKV